MRSGFRIRSVFVIAVVLAWMLFASMLPPAWAQPTPVNPDDVLHIMPYWFPYSGASDAAVAAEIADMRNRLGPEGPYVKLGFAVYVFVSMDDWNVDSDDPAAVRAALASTIAQIDRHVDKGRRVGVPIALSVLTPGRDRVDPVQSGSEQEDVRSMHWYADNHVASGWWSYSRYARKARRIQEAYVREIGRVIANRMHLYPDVLVAASGDGEVELPFAREDTATGTMTNFGDYSPFTMAEFRDWLRNGGLYAAGGPYAGQGYSRATRYADDASPAVDTNGDGHTLNGDFGTSFTTWDLLHFNWALSDPWAAGDPGAIASADYVETTFDPMPADSPGGFDAPRTFARGQAWWDVWELFKQTMLQRHNQDFARWVTTSPDPDTGATVPTTRWHSYQIPADYLFNGTPEYPNGRWYSSMSSWWTADTAPYGSLGITSFNIDFGDWQAITLPNVAPHVAERDIRWGVIEWNPGVTAPTNGESTNTGLFDAEMAVVERYRPALLQPWVWDDPNYWNPCCGIKDTEFEAALRRLVARLKEGTPPDPRLELESVATGQQLVQPFDLTGWAIDLGKIRGPGRGPGVDLIEVDAHPVGVSPDGPDTIGTATYGLARADVAALYGSQFRPSGFTFRVTGLAPGAYELVIRGRSTVTSTFIAEARVTVEIFNPLDVGPTGLRFTATRVAPGSAGIRATPPQPISVSYTGAGSPSWVATANQSWMQVTQATGTGAGRFSVAIVNPADVIGTQTSLAGTVTVLAANVGAIATIPVTLDVDQSGVATAAPFGLVDTPAQNADNVVGAMGITGWAVDDVGIEWVRLYRNCLSFEPQENCSLVDGQWVVYLGDATIVAGARPDIEARYPDYPEAYRAGWGYTVLTNLAPHIPKQEMAGGQGPLTIYARARDAEGHEVWLGRNFAQGSDTQSDGVPTAITMANDGIDTPFGTIDTPRQGDNVSGESWNWGWVLTPDWDTIAGAGDIAMPVDGSTITVWIDGQPRGTVLYNLCRGQAVVGAVGAGQFCDDDIASIFGNQTEQPLYTPRSSNPTRHRNLDAGRGAMAGFYLDTTTLTNGVHTIAWAAYDSAGRGQGLGSRYFAVLNTGTDADRRQATGDRRQGEDRDLGSGASSVTLSRRDTTDPRSRVPGPGTPAEVRGRTGFDLHAPFAVLTPGADGIRRVQIDDMGRLELQFGAEVSDAHLVANGEYRPLPVGSQFDAETGTFTWAPGVGFIGTYRLAFGRAGSPVPSPVEGPSPPSSGAFGPTSPTALPRGSTHSPRPEPVEGRGYVGQAERALPHDAADVEWGRETSPTGPRSPVPGPGEDLVLIDVTIRPASAPAPGEAAIRMSLDTPQLGATVSGSFLVGGWALDPHAAIGSGIGAVHVWAQRTDVAGSSPVFLGVASLDGARPDVARVHGAQFHQAGFGLAASGLEPGTYDVTAYVWVSRTARWEDARTVTVTVR